MREALKCQGNRLTSGLSRVSGAARSPGCIRARAAELHVYSFSRIIPGAIPHPHCVNHADLLVDRSRAAHGAQLRNSRLANSTVGRFRSHCGHGAVYLVRRNKFEDVISQSLLRIFRTLKRSLSEKKRIDNSVPQ